MTLLQSMFEFLIAHCIRFSTRIFVNSIFLWLDATKRFLLVTFFSRWTLTSVFSPEAGVQFFGLTFVDIIFEFWRRNFGKMEEFGEIFEKKEEFLKEYFN